MSYPISDTSWITGGFYPGPNTTLGATNYGPLLCGGAPVLLDSTQAPTPFQDPQQYTINPTIQQALGPTASSDLIGLLPVRDTTGSIIVPNGAGLITLNSGQTIGYDPTTTQGRITPFFPGLEVGGYSATLDGGLISFTGSNVRILIECAEIPKGSTGRYYKQLLEATTISVGIHREVAPARAGGFINPKGFALGKRTIAGTLILTQFTADTLYDFLQDILMVDGSKDSLFTKVDQLPPFNITMLLASETGYVSSRRLLGVKFLTDGTVYSIQDMLTEQTLSWMALDFTPLTPLTLNNMFKPASAQDQTTNRQRTPNDLMAPQGATTSWS